MTASRTQSQASRTRKKAKKQVVDAIAHIYASLNNTIVTITDMNGNKLASESAASCGYRGSRKSTPYAAGEAAAKVILAVMDMYGVKNLHVRVRGLGAGREAAIRSLSKPNTNTGSAEDSSEGSSGSSSSGYSKKINILSLTDVTGIPFNGVRDPKKRRV